MSANFASFFESAPARRNYFQLLRSTNHRHQRRHVSPQVVAAKKPARVTDPLLSSPDILNNQRNLSAGRFARFALNSKTGFKKGIVRRRKRPGSSPRHRPIAVRLARRRSDNHTRVDEPRTVQRKNIFQYQLTRISARSIVVPLHIETDHTITFSQKSFRPAAEPT